MQPVENHIEISLIYVIYELGYGGQERQLSHALRSMSNAGISVELIVWNQSEVTTEVYGINNLEIKTITLKGGTFHKIRSFRKLIKQKTTNGSRVVVQTWSYPLNFYCVLGCLANGAISVGALRTDFQWLFHSVKGHTKIKLIADAISPKYIISNNEKSRKSLESFRRIFLRKQKLFYLSNKLALPDITEFSKNKERVLNSVSVGSLLPYKRWDFLVDVIYEMSKMGVPVRHNHVGENGPLKQELIDLVQKKGLREKFTFQGQKKNLDSYYRNADILIHTSEVEGTPNAILEGMSYGLPIFTSNCGDVKTFVDESNGFVFSDYDQKNWANRISKSLDYQYQETLSKVSREKAEKLLDLDDLTTSLTRIYKKILKDV